MIITIAIQIVLQFNITVMKNIFKKIITIAISIFKVFKKKEVYIPIALFLFLCFAYYLIWYLPDSMQIKSLELENKIRATYATIVGGVGAFIIIIVQIIRANLLKKQIDQQQEQNEEQRRANISSLTLDQYVKAVDQLKDKNMAVRLGGIYSLEKIMNSPDKEVKDYHDTIIELLCAYVREKRPFDQDGYNKELEFFIKENSDPAVENYYSEYEKFIKSLNKYKIPIYTDIRAILSVLGRRDNRKNEKVEIDLKDSNWINTGLYNININGFNFLGAHLENAYLQGAHLENAYFMGAHLENAYFMGAHLENANLYKAHLENANLNGAHLENADLSWAHLENADLTGIRLENANLRGTNLENADVKWALLKYANLSEAHLENAYLRGINLENANLTGAHLENAYLYYANFKNVKLIPWWENREETKEEVIAFIKELEKARLVEGIKLDEKFVEIIMKNEKDYPKLFKEFKDRIKEEFPDIFKRIKEGEE